MEWAVECFRLAASGVADGTQMHSHMCYSEFNEMIEQIAGLDADVISIEARGRRWISSRPSNTSVPERGRSRRL